MTVLTDSPRTALQVDCPSFKDTAFNFSIVPIENSNEFDRFRRLLGICFARNRWAVNNDFIKSYTPYGCVVIKARVTIVSRGNHGWPVSNIQAPRDWTSESYNQSGEARSA